MYIEDKTYQKLRSSRLPCGLDGKNQKKTLQHNLRFIMIIEKKFSYLTFQVSLAFPLIASYQSHPAQSDIE